MNDSQAVYTGSRLQRVRLLRAPTYNEQIFFSERNISDLYQCLKSSVTMGTAYNEHIFMNEVARCKRDSSVCSK